MKPLRLLGLGLSAASFILTGDPSTVVKEIGKAVLSSYSGTDWADIADNFPG